MWRFDDGDPDTKKVALGALHCMYAGCALFPGQVVGYEGQLSFRLGVQQGCYTQPAMSSAPVGN